MRGSLIDFCVVHTNKRGKRLERSSSLRERGRAMRICNEGKSVFDSRGSMPPLYIRVLFVKKNEWLRGTSSFRYNAAFSSSVIPHQEARWMIQVIDSSINGINHPLSFEV